MSMSYFSPSNLTHPPRHWISVFLLCQQTRTRRFTASFPTDNNNANQVPKGSSNLAEFTIVDANDRQKQIWWVKPIYHEYYTPGKKKFPLSLRGVTTWCSIIFSSSGNWTVAWEWPHLYEFGENFVGGAARHSCRALTAPPSRFFPTSQKWAFLQATVQSLRFGMQNVSFT